MDYYNYSDYVPRVSSREPQYLREDHGNPNRPTQDRLARNLPPKYFEIQPYLDNILNDQLSENREVQRNLRDLRSINERLISDLGDNRYSRQEEPVREGLWEQIQRVIRQIIDNSEGEAEEFKASLQHLRNLNHRTLDEDLGYHEEGESRYSQPAQHQRRDRGRGAGKAGYSQYRPLKDEYTQGYTHPNRPLSETFEPRTENQRRLMDQIEDLKDENRYLRQRLRQEVDKNRSLTNELEDLESQNYSKSNYRGQREDRGRQRIVSGGDYENRREKEYLGRLNQQLKDTHSQNNTLRQELKGLGRRKEDGKRGSIEEMKQHLGELGNYVAASQRRATEYESLKNNQQQVLDELNRLKYGNKYNGYNGPDALSKARSQSRYKNYSDDERIRNLETSLAQNRNEGDYRRDARERPHRDTHRYY